MSERRSERAKRYSRRLLIGIALLALFVLCDIGLFGWLIFRSLSQREINEIILETRKDAEEVAGQIAASAEAWDRDLLMAVATNSETRTYIDSVLAQREIVQMVRIFDHEEKLVFQAHNDQREGEIPESLSARSDGPEIVTETTFEDTTYQVVEVPVGDLGNIQIGLRREEIEKRLRVLRSELMRLAQIIGGLTIALFVSAYLLILRLRRRAQRLEEEVEEAERMAYVGTLASGLAHEIRSPLNSLNLNMQMLEEDLESGSQSSGGQLLEITRSEISRLERLVTDFLSYAKPRPTEKVETRPVELLRRVVEIQRARVQQEGTTIEVADRSQGALVAVDEGQIHQLLLNLVENALQATDKVDSPRVVLSAERRGDRLVLSVEDNGIGMDAEERSKAAELFYSKRKGGTGLGLAIASRIAKSHGGDLRLESTPGAGTKVEVDLLLMEPRIEKAVVLADLQPEGADGGWQS